MHPFVLAERIADDDGSITWATSTHPPTTQQKYNFIFASHYDPSSTGGGGGGIAGKFCLPGELAGDCMIKIFGSKFPAMSNKSSVSFTSGALARRRIS